MFALRRISEGPQSTAACLFASFFVTTTGSDFACWHIPRKEPYFACFYPPGDGLGSTCSPTLFIHRRQVFSALRPPHATIFRPAVARERCRRRVRPGRTYPAPPADLAVRPPVGVLPRDVVRHHVGEPRIPRVAVVERRPAALVPARTVATRPRRRAVAAAPRRVAAAARRRAVAAAPRIVRGRETPAVWRKRVPRGGGAAAGRSRRRRRAAASVRPRAGTCRRNRRSSAACAAPTGT